LKKIYNKNYIKIGILGGTFDPPHKGHLHISKYAIRKLKLNKLIWIVTKKNPFKKKPILSINKRIKLSKKIINNKKISVQYLDDIVKSSKTFNVLNYIKNRNKNSKLYLLIGADNLTKFHKWNNWKNIPKLASIAIIPRQKYSMKSFNPIVYKKLNKRNFIYIKMKKINISSTLIRKL